LKKKKEKKRRKLKWKLKVQGKGSLGRRVKDLLLAEVFLEY